MVVTIIKFLVKIALSADCDISNSLIIKTLIKNKGYYLPNNFKFQCRALFLTLHKIKNHIDLNRKDRY